MWSLVGSAIWRLGFASVWLLGPELLVLLDFVDHEGEKFSSKT